MVRRMPFQLLPLIFVVIWQLFGALNDPFMRNLPELTYATPRRAPDEVGKASTYGRRTVDPETGKPKDSASQAYMASAEHVRIDDTMHVCASRHHRFGTLLLLQHVGTGRTTLCRVTDRGPYGCEWLDPETDKTVRLNLAILRRDLDPRATACVPRGIIDMAPAVRAALAPGDGGLQGIRAWVLDRPQRAVHVRRPSS